LKHLCKIYEANKRTEKEKRRKEIKIRKGPRGTLSAQQRKEPAAQEANN
jgi:hypothetical protein